MKFIAAVIAAVVAALVMVACGGEDRSSSTSESASHNAQILGAAQANSSSQASIHSALHEAVGLYHYAGVDDTFATPDGGHCSVDGIYTAPSDVRSHQNNKNTLLSPDGKAAVLVVAFQGDNQATCLKTVVDGLHWAGGTRAPTPSGPLTAAELASHLNEICTRTFPVIAAGYHNVNNFTADQLAAADSSTQPTRSERLEEFRALQPPANLTATYQQFVQSYETYDQLDAQERDEAARLAEPFVKQDYHAIHAIQDQETASNKEQNVLAKKLGATQCVG